MENVSTEVTSIFRDMLNNDIIYTAFATNHIRENIENPFERKKKIYREYGFQNLSEILKSPQIILKDLKENALLYCREYKGKYVAVVVGLDSRYLYTTEPLSLNFSSKRYKIIYKEE